MDDQDEIRNTDFKTRLIAAASNINTSKQALYESEQKVSEETLKRTFFEHLSQLHLIAGMFFLVAGIVFIMYWNGDSLGVSADSKNLLLWTTCSLMALSFLMWTIIIVHNPKLEQGTELDRSNTISTQIIFALGFLVIAGGVVALNLFYNTKNTPSAYISFSIIVPAIFLGYIISYYWSRELLPYVLDKYILNQTGVTMNQFGLLLLFSIIAIFVTLMFKDSIFSGLNVISIIMLLLFGGLCVTTVAYIIWTLKTDKSHTFDYLESKPKE